MTSNPLCAFIRHYAEMLLAMLLRRDQYNGHTHRMAVAA